MMTTVMNRNESQENLTIYPKDIKNVIVQTSQNKVNTTLKIFSSIILTLNSGFSYEYFSEYTTGSGITECESLLALISAAEKIEIGWEQTPGPARILSWGFTNNLTDTL